MATTKHPAVYDCHVSFAHERPRLFIDCGFRIYSVWFSDTEELARYLDEAVKHSGLPWQAAESGLRTAQAEIGSYVDWECDRHFVNDYIPPREPASFSFLNPWAWGVVIGAVLTYATALFFVGE